MTASTARKVVGIVLLLAIGTGTVYLTILTAAPIRVPYCGPGCARETSIGQIMSAGLAVLGIMLAAVVVRGFGLAPWRKTLQGVALVTFVISVLLISWAVTKSMNPLY